MRIPVLLLALWFPAWAFAGSAEPVSSEMIRLVRQDCGACHGMTLKGGLGKPLTREALSGFSPEALTVIILHGKEGTAMPPWKSLLSEAQARWIAEQLLAGFPEEAQP
ncbi:c-type cytochrome [Sulfuricystis multivorans]|uniref:c-type cytochrome n=1 Tax=Sulfuricystis multivorans TaxID=2211108 RepID=UPI000F8215B7|nr:cytochrome c [Sulfuricystis multivorans]